MGTIAKLCSILGMICLQISSVPAIVQAIQTGETAPLLTLCLIAFGLAFCCITEAYYRLWAYLIGSIIGLIGHLAIIAIVLTR